jgi:hypothetical protein
VLVVDVVLLVYLAMVQEMGRVLSGSGGRDYVRMKTLNQLRLTIWTALGVGEYHRV